MQEAGRLAEQGPRSHEVRASEAVLNAEVALRSGDGDGAAAALQDAEILLAQSPLAAPFLLGSLQRSAAVAAGPTKARVQALERGMGQRLG